MKWTIISFWCLQILFTISKPFQCVSMCAFYVYIITLTVFTMTPRSRASSGRQLNLSITVLMWHVLLFSSLCFFLCVLTSEGGSVCLGVAILCTVMCFFGVHNELSKPFVLFCFFLSLPPSSPPIPLSYCSPPPTGCAFVTFATRAMAQNAIKTMHHSQTMEVLYPLAPISHLPPLLTLPHTFCCPLVLERRRTCPSRWCPFITEHESFPEPLLPITNYVVVSKIIE